MEYVSIEQVKEAVDVYICPKFCNRIFYEYCQDIEHCDQKQVIEFIEKLKVVAIVNETYKDKK
jgi:hypothetical protein